MLLAASATSSKLSNALAGNMNLLYHRLQAFDLTLCGVPKTLWRTLSNKTHKKEYPLKMLS
jgi:hypothetical protein